MPSIPKLSDPALAARARNPIDAFVLAKVAERALSPSDDADRLTLIRRVTYDLTGLPPTPSEVESFVADPDPLAYEKLVDRLLASATYGERWARHWLDVVHYGDTHGYDKDKVRPNAWPYRDYVIRSLNEDKPYGRFVKEQLAGDFFYPESPDGIVALGFIAAGPFDWVAQVELKDDTLDKAITRNLDRDDMVATAMNTFVSLTAQCARCHDHKFDPISQAEYYGLQAVFAGVDRADRTYDVDPAVARERSALRREIEAANGRRAQLHDASQEELAKLDDVVAAASKRLKALPAPGLVFAAATEFTPNGTFRPTNGKPRPIRVLHRGSEKDPGEEAVPGGLGVVPELGARFDPSASEAGRRAALAEWIVDRRNPLTWRSIVNRVWQYHFGRGLVETVNDFGRMGAAPTHPGLVDYLAVGFRDGGQSIKSLQRLIVTSSTYRQSSADNPACAAIDAENRCLWRMSRRRLEAEAVRDSILSVAGKLDPKMGGPGYRDFAFEDDHSPRYKYHEYDPDDPATHRRSIYRLIVRSSPDPLMETLDCADPSQIVPKRNETLTPLQALTLLNNPFVVRMAEHFAARVEPMAPHVEGRIDAACKLALGRPATPEERQILARVASKHGLASACRLILNTNEFLFVD